MRRLSVVALSVLLLAAIPALATAEHSPGKGPKHNLVVGSARFSTPVASVRINAKSGPNGENPRGHFFLTEFGWQFRGSVCGWSATWPASAAELPAPAALALQRWVVASSSSPRTTARLAGMTGRRRFAVPARL
jgi:hypothetical protein